VDIYATLCPWLRATVMDGSNVAAAQNIGANSAQLVYSSFAMVQSFCNTVHLGCTMEIPGEFQVERVILTKTLLKQQLVKL
jgi:hypothetical protein